MATTTHVSLTTPSESPYQLDPNQTLRASKTLLDHIRKETKRLQTQSEKKSLLKADGSDDEDESDSNNDVPVWLSLTTKQHIVDKKRLKPSRIQVPHSLNPSPDLKICLITADPQRSIKNIVADPAFPPELHSRIDRIIGFQKLKARYKSFEQRRALLAEHDIFLADDRIVTRLPSILGTVFYKGTAKRPVPINIAEQAKADGKRVKSNKTNDNNHASFASTATVAKEITKAVDSVPVSLRPGTSVSLRVGRASFTDQQLLENINAVVEKLIEKHVGKGWRNVKSIHIKSPTSMSIPVWLADELWAEEENVDEMETIIETKAESDSRKRKRNPLTKKGPQTGSRKRVKIEDREDGGAALRKEKLASQKAAILKPETIAV